MSQNTNGASPSRLANGVYELVLIRCISQYRTKYAKDGLIMIFKEIESGEEIARTISIPNESVKAMTSQSTANNFINLIIGQEEDTLELRRSPQQLAQKMINFGGGRVFRGFLVKNERGFMDLLSIGEGEK